MFRPEHDDPFSVNHYANQDFIVQKLTFALYTLTKTYAIKLTRTMLRWARVVLSTRCT